MHLHSTDGTEFLTAEASDAARAIDHGFFIFHHDCFRRADIGAFLATDAAAADGRTRAERALRNEGEGASEEPALAGKGKASTDRNVFKIARLRKGAV